MQWGQSVACCSVLKAFPDCHQGRVQVWEIREVCVERDVCGFSDLSPSRHHQSARGVVADVWVNAVECLPQSGRIPPPQQFVSVGGLAERKVQFAVCRSIAAQVDGKKAGVC